MIHVEEQPEPSHFDTNVRQKGLAYLRKHGIALDQPLLKGTKIEPYWQGECLNDLYNSYHGICAYLAVHFEKCTGAGSTDHFIAKSAHAGLAYEWRNYRLACLALNREKGTFADVIDPFTLENGWFQLELVTGKIYPGAFPVCPSL